MLKKFLTVLAIVGVMMWAMPVGDTNALSAVDFESRCKTAGWSFAKTGNTYICRGANEAFCNQFGGNLTVNSQNSVCRMTVSDSGTSGGTNALSAVDFESRCKTAGWSFAKTGNTYICRGANEAFCNQFGGSFTVNSQNSVCRMTVSDSGASGGSTSGDGTSGTTGDSSTSGGSGEGSTNSDGSSENTTQNSMNSNDEANTGHRCGGVNTSIVDCEDDNSEGGGIFGILLIVLNVLTFGIGIAGTLGIVIAGVMYLTARDSEAQLTKAKNMLLNVVIGLIAYALLWVFLQWLIPGGIIG